MSVIPMFLIILLGYHQLKYPTADLWGSLAAVLIILVLTLIFDVIELSRAWNQALREAEED